MNIGLYQSAASLSALERWQDAVSQNITSSQVPGYRQRQINFSTQEGGQLAVGGAKGGSDTDVTGSFPVTSSSINFSQGESQPTGRPLDISIQGPGFFQVRRPDGSRAYTRNGEFSIRADGTTSGCELSAS